MVPGSDSSGREFRLPARTTSLGFKGRWQRLEEAKNRWSRRPSGEMGLAAGVEDACATPEFCLRARLHSRLWARPRRQGMRT